MGIEVQDTQAYLPSYDQLHDRIVQWATDRKIIPNAKPHSQLLKAVAEMGELADAENKGDINGIIDGVGDVMVCLINYCALIGVDPVYCLNCAWEEIKDRKGTLMPSGVFVKEA